MSAPPAVTMTGGKSRNPRVSRQSSAGGRRPPAGPPEGSYGQSAHNRTGCHGRRRRPEGGGARRGHRRSEEHTSELPSLMRISYAVFCLKKKRKKTTHR